MAEEESREFPVSVDNQSIIINPSDTVLTALITELYSTDGSARVLAVEDIVDTVLSDFLVASRAADLIESGRLTLRTLDEKPHLSGVVSTESLDILVSLDTHIESVTAKRAAASRVYTKFNTQWDDATEYTLRVPGRSRLMETLRDDLGHGVASDFEHMLSELDELPRDSDINEVALALLVAAENEELLYDVSRWGEEVGLASKATFSRTKTKLEDWGHLDTEKVPLDVGRPRLRLLPGRESPDLDGLSTTVRAD